MTEVKYNIDYIDLKYNLIKCFLINIDENILDVSYRMDGNKITIQIVLLKEHTLSKKIKNNVQNILSKYDVNLNEVYISKDQFNETINEWEPKYYKWLDYLLFSKTEII